MKSSSLCSLLFNLSLIIISQSPLQANAESGAKLIANVCNDSLKDKAECLRVLGSNPKISSSENYFDLSKNLLEFAVNRGIEVQNFLKEVQKKTYPSSAAMAECANFCYDGVVSSFRSAILELKEDPDTANYDAKVAADGPDTCNEALAGEHINNPAISALNREISLLSQFAFLATNYLPKGG